MLGHPSFSQALTYLKVYAKAHTRVYTKSAWLLSLLALLAACTGVDSLDFNDQKLSYDIDNYTNTRTYNIPDSRSHTGSPSLPNAQKQALIEDRSATTLPNYQSTTAVINQRQQRAHDHSDYWSERLPPYLIIGADELDQWRYAHVDAQAGARDLFGKADRLPLDRTLNQDNYLVIRPIRQIYATNPTMLRSKQHSVYLFKVLASAVAGTSSGNLLDIHASVSAARDGDWVIPLSAFSLNQTTITYAQGPATKQHPISVLAIAPERIYGMTGQFVIMNAGNEQGIAVGSRMIAHAGRMTQVGSARAVRDGRSIRPEGSAKLDIIQTTQRFALAEIVQASQPISAGDRLLRIQ